MPWILVGGFLSFVLSPRKALESELLLRADFFSESVLFHSLTGLMFLISFHFLFFPLNSHLSLLFWSPFTTLSSFFFASSVS